MTEIWKSIEGYETYSVSTFGNVRNDTTGKVLKPTTQQNRQRITLCLNGYVETFLTYRLVAFAFIPNPKCKKVIDHIDNNSLNNNVENLRWTTQSENICNSTLSRVNTSGVKGVYWDKSKQKWKSQICINKKVSHIGSYNTIEEATIARQTKANEIFGAYTNDCEKL